MTVIFQKGSSSGVHLFDYCWRCRHLYHRNKQNNPLNKAAQQHPATMRHRWRAWEKQILFFPKSQRHHHRQTPLFSNSNKVMYPIPANARFKKSCRRFKEGGVHPFRGLPNTSIEKKLHKTFGNSKIHLKILVSNFILWSQFIRLILNPQNIKCMDAPAYSCGTWFEKFILINIHVYWDISPFRVCWLYCWIKSKN